MKTTDQQFPIQDGHDDLTINWFYRTVNDQYIIIKYPGLAHGISFHPEKISGRLIPDKLLIEVDASFHIIVSGCSKTDSICCFYQLLVKLFGKNGKKYKGYENVIDDNSRLAGLRVFADVEPSGGSEKPDNEGKGAIC